MSSENGSSLWRIQTVTERTGLSRAEIYRRMRLGQFPGSIKLGVRLVAWKSSDVEAWIKSLTAYVHR
ncbi:helix-turn-helix transcriptional regulator [Pseudoduganella sp.]|uniref:helix-turn-helix transcriptional regulator n=1 Tax=Pseudoduganella sp. TaxID=1880898 RepID=UPI0035AD99CC